MDNDTLEEKSTLTVRGSSVLDLAYSPDGAYLAAADNSRGLYGFQATDYEVGSSCHLSNFHQLPLLQHETEATVTLPTSPLTTLKQKQLSPFQLPPTSPLTT